MANQNESTLAANNVAHAAPEQPKLLAQAGQAVQGIGAVKLVYYLVILGLLTVACLVGGIVAMWTAADSKHPSRMHEVTAVECTTLPGLTCSGRTSSQSVSSGLRCVLKLFFSILYIELP